eukprot:6200436-Pleurochrysis_carterae.AAC.1
MALHEKFYFHLAVATDGAKKGGRRTGWNHRRYRRPHMGYGKARNRRKYSEIKGKRRQRYTKVRNQTESDRQTASSRTGTPKRKTGGSATSAEAELFAIFAILRKV